MTVSASHGHAPAVLSADGGSALRVDVLHVAFNLEVGLSAETRSWDGLATASCTNENTVASVNFTTKNKQTRFPSQE